MPLIIEAVEALKTLNVRNKDLTIVLVVIELYVKLTIWAAIRNIVAVDVLVMLNSLCNCLIMVVVLVDK